MGESEFEKRRREIQDAAWRYQANHWRGWFPRAVVFILPILTVVVFLGLGLLLWSGLDRIGVDGRVGEAVLVGMGLAGVFAGVFAYLWFCQRWFPGDPRLSLPSLPPEQQASRKRMHDYLWLPLCLAFGIALTYAPSRYDPLVWAAFMGALETVDFVILRRLGARGPWANPITPWLLGVYAAYAVAVAAGLPELGGPRYGFFLRFGLPFGVIFLNMLLSSLYSYLQFRRLQRLVSETPPKGGDGA